MHAVVQSCGNITSLCSRHLQFPRLRTESVFLIHKCNHPYTVYILYRLSQLMLSHIKHPGDLQYYPSSRCILPWWVYHTHYTCIRPRPDWSWLRRPALITADKLGRRDCYPGTRYQSGCVLSVMIPVPSEILNGGPTGYECTAPIGACWRVISIWHCV